MKRKGRLFWKTIHILWYSMRVFCEPMNFSTGPRLLTYLWSFLRVFYSLLYHTKYSYLIKIICKLISLTKKKWTLQGFNTPRADLRIIVKKNWTIIIYNTNNLQAIIMVFTRNLYFIIDRWGLILASWMIF